jgi:hypothetical protein
VLCAQISCPLWSWLCGFVHRRRLNVRRLKTNKEEEKKLVDVALHWGEPRISCVLMCFVRCCLCVYLLSVVVIMYDEWI